MNQEEARMFDEPALGVIAKGAFCFITNSQRGSVDNSGKLAPTDKLRNHVILKTAL